MKILIVEDDRKVASFVELALKEEGHIVDRAADGEEATLLAGVNEYDVILLDIGLPKKDGFQVARELRQEGSGVPILMLTERGTPEDVVHGLDAGADDYLPKPFHLEELLARVRALHRRGGTHHLEILRLGPVVMDRLAHRVTVHDRPLDLTPREFQLLECFLLHPRQVLRRALLLDEVWSMHFAPRSNIVEVEIGNLRRKLHAAAGRPILQTIRGQGYRLSEESVG